MPLSRARLTCRSHNPFTPSIALWQHFILPNPPVLYHQRLSSSAPSATEPTNESNDSESLPVQASLDDNLPNGATYNGFRLRKTGWPLKLPNTLTNALPKREHDAQRFSKKPLSSNEVLMHRTKREVEEREDYNGVVVSPLRTAKGTKGPPWFLKQQLHDSPELQRNAMERLSIEIARFHQYAKPSRLEALARRHLVEKVRVHTQNVLPDDVLEIFGSERTGLSLAMSDIDLRLMSKEAASDTQKNPLPPSRTERYRLLKKLYTLQGSLQEKKDYMLVALRHARYPLISLQDRATGLDVQIVLSNDTSVSRAAMSQYLQEYPYLHELYTVIKTMFDVRVLSDVYHGGFGSYSIFMMIVASLRLSPPEQANAAGGLLNFLKFWGSFDTCSHGVSIEPPMLLDKEAEPVLSDRVKAKIQNSERKAPPKFLLSLRDPADSTNDLGRKGLCIKHVQVTCQSLFEIMTSNMDRPEAFNVLIQPIVGHVYSMQLQRRKKLETQGEKVLNKVQRSLAAKAKEIREAEKAGTSQKEKLAHSTISKPVAGLAYHEHGDAISSLFEVPLVEKLAASEAQEINTSSASGNTHVAPSEEPTSQWSVEQVEQQIAKDQNPLQNGTTKHT